MTDDRTKPFECRVQWSDRSIDTVSLTELLLPSELEVQWKHDPLWKGVLKNALDWAVLEVEWDDGSRNIVDVKDVIPLNPREYVGQPVLWKEDNTAGEIIGTQAEAEPVDEIELAPAQVLATAEPPATPEQVRQAMEPDTESTEDAENIDPMREELDGDQESDPDGGAGSYGDGENSESSCSVSSGEESGATNCWIQYRRDSEDLRKSEILDLYSFKANLADSLCRQNKVARVPRSGPPPKRQRPGRKSGLPPSDIRLDQLGHWPIGVGSEHRGQNCKLSGCKTKTGHKMREVQCDFMHFSEELLQDISYT